MWKYVEVCGSDSFDSFNDDDDDNDDDASDKTSCAVSQVPYQQIK